MRMHYGWAIAIVCMLMISSTSLLNTTMAVSLNALRDVYGFTGTETSLITTVQCLSAFLISFLSDRYFDRLGLRMGMVLSMVSGAVAFTLYALSGTFLFGYYLGAIFGGLTYALGMMMPASIVIRRWFAKDRGLALGLASAGTGLSTMACSPLLQNIIDTSGVTESFVFEIAYMLICALCLFVVIRNFPEERGLRPFGEGETDTKKDVSRGSFIPLSGSWFVILALMTVIAGMGGTPSTSNFVLNFTTAGIDSTAVSFGMTVYGLLLIVSKLLFGRVVDWRGSCFATALFGTILVIGLLGSFLVVMMPQEWFMFACFGFLGFGYGLVTLGYTNWAMDFTAPEEYPRMLKKLMIAFQLGALAGSPLPGLIADATGSYSPAYLVFGIAFLIQIVSISLMYRTHTSGRAA